MVSVNDDVVILAAWHKNNGDYVKARTVICEIETAKSVVDIEAESEGYLFHLVEEGAQIATNTAFAVISDNDEPSVINDALQETEQNHHRNIVSDRKYTKKAEFLARQHGIDIFNVPSDDTIKEADVLAYLGKNSNLQEYGHQSNALIPVTGSQRILIIGGGYGAAHIVDAIERSALQTAVGILDDNPTFHGKHVAGIEVMGSISQIKELFNNGFFDAAIFSFGDIKRRESLFNELVSQGIPFANVIDCAALVHSNVLMGKGNVLLANSRIAACTSIGDNNFLSAFVNIDHHNRIGDNCTFGPGVMASGRVHIGNNVLFGTGIFVEPGINIGSGSVISSGSVITTHIPEGSIVKRYVDIKIQSQNEA